jgi:hypothetical protein
MLVWEVAKKYLIKDIAACKFQESLLAKYWKPANCFLVKKGVHIEWKNCYAEQVWRVPAFVSMLNVDMSDIFVLS